ncbi:MAG TPA: TetR/AcrR family transcriptional regulator [Gammaproteobacteria bacterium]|nr:TetR/AcrR family transcriptional regulator [Gammaproteobacteria bacterium]
MSTPKTKILPGSPFPGGVAECDAASCARDRIFEAARKLFYKYGIRGVSVDAIAAEADTTKVTLYRVFESKEDLVVKVLEDQSKRFWSWWDSVIAQHQGDARAQLDVLFANIRDKLAVLGADRGCPLSNASVEIVEEEHPARAIIRAHKAALTRRLRALCREMGARQPDVLGDSLSLLLMGTFSARIGDDASEQVASIHDAAMALLDSPALGVARAKAKR